MTSFRTLGVDIIGKITQYIYNSVHFKNFYCVYFHNIVIQYQESYEPCSLHIIRIQIMFGF
jgi:hypothetical protein